MPPLSSWARALLVVLAVLTALYVLVGWGVEYLWLQALGYESVFWTIRLLKFGLFLFAFVVAFLYFWLNFRFRQRL